MENVMTKLTLSKNCMVASHENQIMNSFNLRLHKNKRRMELSSTLVPRKHLSMTSQDNRR